jgi:hypothetical protein
MQIRKSHKKTLPDVRGEIVAFFKRNFHRPVFIGQVAITIGCSLADTEAFFDALCHEGTLRPLSPEEAKRAGIEHGFLLVGVTKAP